MVVNKNSSFFKFAATIFIILLLQTNCLAESIENGWEIDFKSTRVFAQVDDDGKTHVDFVGTLSNYGSKDASEVKIDVKILNDGVIPVAPEGGSNKLELYITKVIYTIEDFKVGETKDWIVRSEIIDIENVDVIDYQIKIFVQSNSDEGFETIYEQDKSVDVVIADTSKDKDTDNDGLIDIYEIEIGTDIYDKDTDDDRYTDFEEFDSGTDPLDKNSNVGVQRSKDLGHIGMFIYLVILTLILIWWGR